MADQKTEAIKYWKITADGIGNIGMFNQCGLPSMSLQASEFKVWDGQGKPLPLPTGVQAAFGDVTLSRGVDQSAELWKWISTIAQKGCSAETVKEVTLMASTRRAGWCRSGSSRTPSRRRTPPPGWRPPARTS